MTRVDLNFGDLLDAVAQAVPERTAIQYGTVNRSWREFDERTNRLGRFLLSKGLRPDSKVAFYLRNSPAYVELLAACFKARLVHCNVNYRYTDHELFHVLDNSDAEAVVYDSEFQEHLDHLRPRLEKVNCYLRVGAGIPESHASDFGMACEDGDGSPLGISRSGDDLYFMYTGGTTGYPKAVMWPHKERIAVIGMSEATSADDHASKVAASEIVPVLLPAAPLMHSTGFTSAVSTMVAGGTIVMTPSPHFDAESCLSAIDTHRVSRLAIVGDAFSVPLLETLRNSVRHYDLSSVMLISSAGTMWSQRCKLELLDYFTNATLADSLGSSEGSRLGSAVTKRGESVATGAFQVGPDVKVFTEDHREITPGSGEAGLIATAGPLPLGYYKDPVGTARTFPTINGVRYSMAGDWCRLEKDGSMTLLGRGNNCINTGGEKVFPEEVEEALKTMNGVLDAAVLGVPDPRWGQTVAALIRTRGGQPIGNLDIRQHLESLIAGYKHPRQIKFTEQTIRHINGKMNYREVKRLFDSI